MTFYSTKLNDYALKVHRLGYQDWKPFPSFQYNIAVILV